MDTPLRSDAPPPLIGAIRNADVIGNTYTIAASSNRTFGALSYVTEAGVSIDGGAWINVPLADQPPPQPGEAYESRFSAGYVLNNLNALRNSALGTRRRYLFRAVNALGRKAYAERVLEVRLNGTSNHVLHVLSEAQPPVATNAVLVPAVKQVALQLDPLPMNTNDPVVALSHDIYTTQHPEGTNLLTSTEATQRFVVVQNDAVSLRMTAQSNFFPHIRITDPTQTIQAVYREVKTASVHVVSIQLSAFLADRDTQATQPVTVRYNPTPLSTTNDAQRHQYHMRPLTIQSLADSPEGTVTLSVVSGNGNISVWGADSFASVNLPWVINATNLAGPFPQQNVLMNGITNGGQTLLRMAYSYRGATLIEEELLVGVRDIPKVAGERLDGFPFFNYVQTFNESNALHMADSVYAALDPYRVPHLSGNQSLLGRTAMVYVVAHRSPTQWIANPTLTDVSGGADLTTLQGATIASNRTRVWQHAQTGTYDVVYDFGDGRQNSPNGRLDPGDIIGVLTTNALTADVQVVADPSRDVRYTGSAFAEFVGDYISATGALNAASLNVRLRGRIQYPANPASALVTTTPRIQGVRNRSPNGTVSALNIMGGAIPEYWNAIYDGSNWHLRASESGPHGSFPPSAPNQWTLTSTNNRVSFRINEGAVAFEHGDEVYFTVTRTPIAEGPYPLVVVAHGNHSPYQLTQPKYCDVEFLPFGPGTFLNFRNSPGVGGTNDQMMTIFNEHLREGCAQTWVQWEATSNHWEVLAIVVNFDGELLNSEFLGAVASDTVFTIPATASMGIPRFSFIIDSAAQPSLGQDRGFLVDSIISDVTPDENYRGYAYLLEHLAQNGYAVLSISLDDINPADFDMGWSSDITAGLITVIASAGGSFGGIAARSHVLNQMVRHWHGNVNNLRSDLGLNGRISFDDISLIGHSRGAETVARDAVLGSLAGTYGQVVSIAPTDFLAPQNPPTTVTNTALGIPYFVIYGSHDGDVVDGGGFRLYDRATNTKHVAFLDKANHNYFNTSWPQNDLRTNLAPNAFNGASNEGEAKTNHQEIANAYISTFFNAHVVRTNIMGQTIPIRPYYQEFFSRDAAHLRPPTVQTNVVFLQYLGPPTNGAGVATRTIIQDFEMVGAPNRFVIHFDGSNPTNFDRFMQWTAVGDVSWNTPVGPPVVKRYPVPATGRDFRNRQATTLRVRARCDRLREHECTAIYAPVDRRRHQSRLRERWGIG